MAKRGRPKAESVSQIKKPVAEKKVSAVEATEVKEEKIVVSEDVSETEKKSEEPVSIIVPTAEVKEVKEKVAETSAEEVAVEKIPDEDHGPVEEAAPAQTSESFVAELPKAEPEPVKAKPTVKPIEYPPQVGEIANRLRLNPASSRLTDMALLRRASAKLRSRYFFK